MDEVRRIVEALKKREGVLAVILYGSRAKGVEREESDVDICVVVPDGREDLFTEILHLMQDERVDIKIFEDMPLFLKIKVIEEGKVLFVRDELKLFEYFHLIRKIWEDEQIAIRKLFP